GHSQRWRRGAWILTAWRRFIRLCVNDMSGTVATILPCLPRPRAINKPLQKAGRNKLAAGGNRNNLSALSRVARASGRNWLEKGSFRISVQNLSKYFGPVMAIDRLNFEVERGEVVGFLGPNGAGKTTTMRILTSYLPATSGIAKVAGYDVMTQSMQVR